jgi:predicted transcriptional regulator
MFEIRTDGVRVLIVDETTKRADRDRSTAYRSVRRTGLAHERRVTYDYAFVPVNPAEVADNLPRISTTSTPNWDRH